MTNVEVPIQRKSPYPKVSHATIAPIRSVASTPNVSIEGIVPVVIIARSTPRNPL